jgi:hypothetical protein
VETTIVEATQSIEHGPNWGKFLVMRPDAEWGQHSHVDQARPVSVLALHRTPEEIWVLDLATGEGACFRPGLHGSAQLERHRVRVCPLYEPFLQWLLAQDLTDLSALPPVVELPDAPAELFGHRRAGVPDPG